MMVMVMGKTTWLTALLQQAPTAITPPPRKSFGSKNLGNRYIWN